MTEGEKTRLVAWSEELRSVHARLRKALRIAQDAAAEGGSVETASRDLLLFCHGFCTALTGHHVAEDRELFPPSPRSIRTCGRHCASSSRIIR